MSKKKAHLILIFGDILALFALWLGYNEINKVMACVADFADMVNFNNRIGFLIFAAGFIIAHIFIICNNLFLNKIFEKKAAWGNGVFIILGIVLFASAILISVNMRTYVEKAGYLHCPKADKRMTFATYLIYTKNSEICSQLVEGNVKN